MRVAITALACVFLCACASAKSAPAESTAPTQDIGGVDHVGLTVTNIEESKAFFVDVLGFRVRGQDETYPAYFLTNDVTTITLWGAWDDEAGAVEFDRKHNVGLHHLALSVSSFEALDALAEKLKTYPGVVIEFPPELAYGGPARHMMIREPSGARLEFIHRPATP